MRGGRAWPLSGGDKRPALGPRVMSTFQAAYSLPRLGCGLFSRSVVPNLALSPLMRVGIVPVVWVDTNWPFVARMIFSLSLLSAQHETRGWVEFYSALLSP